MISIITATLFFGLISLQSPGVGRRSERESDGFVGNVKKSLEEWTPVFGYPYLQDTRCRARSHVYDKYGRLIQYSFFTGACGSDENRNHYKYDQDGNRTTHTEYIQGKNSPPPPPPPMLPPGQAIKGPPKTTFKYDSQGRITEKANFRANGEPIYRSTYKYDEKGRLEETQVIHSDGTRYRSTYKYESHDSFDGDSNNSKYTTAYTDYELNAQGDWIRRKETVKEATGRTYISIRYQILEYYPVEK
jgi:RHS Repeat